MTYRKSRNKKKQHNRQGGGASNEEAEKEGEGVEDKKGTWPENGSAWAKNKNTLKEVEAGRNRMTIPDKQQKRRKEQKNPSGNKARNTNAIPDV